MHDPSGLTTAEADRRRAAGQGNTAAIQSSRPLRDIIRDNALTFINLVLFAIGAALLLIGRGGDAAVTAGLVAINITVGLFQEIRAKRTLDQIAVLTRPRVRALRDGRETEIDPSDVVVGDVILLEPGDQVVVDGAVCRASSLGLDESLLTGESDIVTKQVGDQVFSGSFCVTGSGSYEAEKVGLESTAYKLAQGARAYRRVLTPLQKQVNLVVRVIVLLASFLGALLVVDSIFSRVSLVESIRIGAVVAGLVPNGLILMIIVAYAMGAVRIARQGALVQQSNAVESLSNVTVVCLDKTGTLTANRIKFEKIDIIDGEEGWVGETLAAFAASASGGTKTSAAIAEALGNKARPVRAEAPFSSSRKWSGLAFEDDPDGWAFVLGAPEVMADRLELGKEQRSKIEQLQIQGRRVLLYAGAKGVADKLPDDWTELPDGTRALAIVSFTDELRPEAADTLRQFAEAGVAIKVISGDSPETVLALVRQAGMPADGGAVSGLDIRDLDDEELADVVQKHTVFGRITPDQKEQLVDALVRQGHYVAMIGDGVNDVLSLKRAHVGIAMRSGSQATRAVADVVLLNDSFGSLAPAIREGQRIRNGMDSILRLFLTRVLAVALLIASVAMINAGFPFSPKHNSILTFLTVGAPTFALALWARPGVPKTDMVRSMLGFVLPAAFWLAVVDLVSYLYLISQNLPAGYNNLTGPEMREALSAAEIIARSGVTTVSVVCGLLLVVFIEPPTEFWAGGAPVSGDWRPTILAGVLALIYFGINVYGPFAEFFELVLHRELDYVIMLGLTFAWAALLRMTWRRNLVGRFLDADLQ